MSCTAGLCRHTGAGVPCVYREGEMRVCGEPREAHHACNGTWDQRYEGEHIAYCRGSGLALGHEYRPEGQGA